MCDAVRLGEILPEVIRDIEKRMAAHRAENPSAPSGKKTRVYQSADVFPRRVTFMVSKPSSLSSMLTILFDRKGMTFLLGDLLKSQK